MNKNANKIPISSLNTKNYSFDLNRTNNQLSNTNILSNKYSYLDQKYTSLKQGEKITKKKPILPEIKNQYSILNKYKKIDQLLDMQSYFQNLYGAKKIQKMKHNKQNNDIERKSALPSIHKNQPSFETQLLKVKMQNMQQRLNRIEPIRIIDYRFPPIDPKINPNYLMNYQRQDLCDKCLSVNQNNKQSQLLKGDKKERRRKLLRKFRIYGIAVYFCILFPHYSLLLGHFKIKQFLGKYLVEDNQHVRYMNSKLMNNLKQIPLYDQILILHNQFAKQKQNQKETSHNKKRNKEVQEKDVMIKILNHDSNDKFVINLSIFKLIINKILNLMSEQIEQFDSDILQFLGIGSLNNSFYADQIFVIEEIPFLEFKLESGCVKLNKSQQKGMMLSNFFIKKIIFQYLLRLGIDQNWQNQLAGKQSMNKKELTQFKLVCKQLELSAFYFYEMAVEIFYSLIMTKNEKRSNFFNLPQESIPLLRKTMKFSNLFTSQQNKKAVFQTQTNIKNFEKREEREEQAKRNKEYNKKTISKTLTKFRSEGIINQEQQQILNEYGQMIQDEALNLIHNGSQYKQLSQIIIPSFGNSYNKFGRMMLEISQRVQEKVIKQRKINFKKYRKQVLEQKYILTHPHQILQGVQFVRKKKQISQIQLCKKKLSLYVQVLKNQRDKFRANSSLTLNSQLFSRTDSNNEDIYQSDTE